MNKKLALLLFSISIQTLPFHPLKKKTSEIAIDPIAKSAIIDKSKCFRFKVSQGDCYESAEWSDCSSSRERAELADYRFAPTEKEIRYNFSILLPHGYQNLAVKQIMGQWHNDVYGPTLSVRHLNGVWWLDLMLKEGKTAQKFFLPPLTPGMLNSFELMIVWSSLDIGKIKLKMNDELVVDYSGKTLDERLEQGPYFRFGLYRSHLYRIPAGIWPSQSVYFCDVSSSL